MRKIHPKNLKPAVMLILALLAGGMAVRVERHGLRLEVEIGKRV